MRGRRRCQQVGHGVPSQRGQRCQRLPDIAGAGDRGGPTPTAPSSRRTGGSGACNAAATTPGPPARATTAPPASIITAGQPVPSQLIVGKRCGQRIDHRWQAVGGLGRAGGHGSASSASRTAPAPPARAIIRRRVAPAAVTSGGLSRANSTSRACPPHRFTERPQGCDMHRHWVDRQARPPARCRSNEETVMAELLLWVGGLAVAWWYLHISAAATAAPACRHAREPRPTDAQAFAE